MREGQANVSRETPDNETGRQVGQYSGETGEQWSGTQAAQVRSGGQVSGETGETGSQAVRRSGATHSGRCALYSLARPYAKSVPNQVKNR